MSSRLSSRLASLKAENEKAMGVFLTSGFPHPDVTDLLLNAIDQGGADFIELGMPHSDPLAEGLPIQESSTRSLCSGTTMLTTLDAVRRFREYSQTPLLLMGYINPILRFGIERFCQQAAGAGVDGLIIPDLPPQESSALLLDAQKNELDIVFLVAPNTSEERMQNIDRLSNGFVYCVSITGLTGTGLEGQMDTINSYLKQARQIITKNPLLVGFGIQTRGDARRLSTYTDGFIVGSAVIKKIVSLWDRTDLSLTKRGEHLAQFVRSLKSD